MHFAFVSNALVPQKGYQGISVHARPVPNCVSVLQSVLNLVQKVVFHLVKTGDGMLQVGENPEVSVALLEALLSLFFYDFAAVFLNFDMEQAEDHLLKGLLEQLLLNVLSVLHDQVKHFLELRVYVLLVVLLTNSVCLLAYL